MIEVVDTGINSFAPVASHVDVPPIEEPVFILTASQLQDLIQEAVERATTPLESRIESLERKVGSGEGGEDAPDSQEGLDLILQVAQHLQEENSALKRELEAFQEHVAQERAFDRQRIARLENRSEKDSPRGEEHIEELYNIMRKNKLLSLSFANAAKFLGISKGRVKQLKPQIAKDGRFDILHSTGHKQMLIIALRRHGAKTG